jgi:EmrB/QacA subfamily drug resistance transporter
LKPNKGLILGLLATAQFMVVLDASIVNVALPAILKGLHFSVDNLQWVITAYTLAFGGFLLFGGRMADLFGRRRTFLIGLIGFTISSMIVGASQSETMMIVARAVQGLAAAFMSPAALSIILTEFREGQDRNSALGVWSAVAAGGAAAGLLFGGILTQYLGWRWDFFVNVPVGATLSLLAIRYIPEHKSTTDHNDFDLPGAVLVTSGLMALVYGITKAPTWGWATSGSISWLAASVVLLGFFVLNEARSKHPLMPLSIFRIRNLSGANLTQLPITAAMFSMFFFISLYVQVILGFDPVKTGLSFLPVTVVIGVTATVVSRFIARVGYKPFMVVAPLIIALGLFMLSHITVGGSYLTGVLPGVSVLAFGVGMSFVSISIAATSGVSQSESGLASGLLNTAQQIGGALGLAILSGIATSKTTSLVKAAGLQARNPLVAAQATVAGFHEALLVGTTFAIAASAISLLVIKQQKGEPEAAEAIGPDLEASPLIHL